MDTAALQTDKDAQVDDGPIRGGRRAIDTEVVLREVADGENVLVVQP